MGGGGGKQPTESTVTQQTIPKELMPYATQLMGRAQALTDINQNPYVSYEGQRTAGLNPLQQQGFMGASNLGVADQIGQGSALAMMGGLGGLNPGQFGKAEADQYMSPYIQNVLNVQKQNATRDYARQLPGLGAGAARVGGFGGTRSALMQSEAQRNLMNQMQGIDAQGMQSAFTNAQQQYNEDQRRRMQGYGQALQGAGLLGQLGQQQFGQQAQSAEMQQKAGASLRDIEQERLSNQYQDFIDQQNYPYQQLAFMSDILRGVPTSDAASKLYRQPPNMAGQIAGLGLGLGSLYGATRGG